MEDYEIRKIELIWQIKLEIARMETYKECLSPEKFLEMYGTKGEILYRNKLKSLLEVKPDNRCEYIEDID